MPVTSLSHRFIIDQHFFNESMLGGREMFLALMYVSSYSQDFRKCHNLVSEKIRAEIIIENPTYRQEYIKMSLNKVNEPSSIEDIPDEVTRNIKYAIHYAKPNAPGEKITPVCILTSDAKKEEYLKSSHLSGIKNVIVLSGEEAREFVISFRDLVWAR